MADIEAKVIEKDRAGFHLEGVRLSLP